MTEFKKRLMKNSSIIATLLLIILIATASFLSGRKIYSMERQRNLELLHNEAEDLVLQIENQAKGDREQLLMLATVASSFDDLRDPSLMEILDSYSTVGLMSDISLLLPDGALLPGGEEAKAYEMDFSELSSIGYHITGREESKDGFVLHHYAPVVRNGDTVAMLCGTVRLDSLPDRITSSLYAGDASIYIIDGENGDFLLDTWHKEELGNFWDLGERPMAYGYDKETLERDILLGRTGHVVFLSRTSGSYLYFQYMPIEVNEWRLALSVPEASVFSTAEAVKRVLNLLSAFEIICFLLYFIWMFSYVRREASQKQRQVDTINSVYEIAKLLFGAHEHRENIGLALEQIADSSGSLAASFWVAGLKENGMSFFWDRVKGLSERENEMPAYCYGLVSLFKSGRQSFEAFDPAELAVLFDGKAPTGLVGLTAIPLVDVGGSLCGILAVENPTRGEGSCSMLRSVSYSFSMLCQNLCGYITVIAKGEIDALTGLFNRNRFEHDLPGLSGAYADSLACVYIDTNGLRETNNTHGHHAGDKLLRDTAGEIQRWFKGAYSYRIGGDEFVLFIPDMPREAVLHLCKRLESSLISKDIYISVGMHWSDRAIDIDSLMKTAENRMYVSKREYYDKLKISDGQRQPLG